MDRRRRRILIAGLAGLAMTSAALLASPAATAESIRSDVGSTIVQPAPAFAVPAAPAPAAHPAPVARTDVSPAPGGGMPLSFLATAAALAVGGTLVVGVSALQRRRAAAR
ncbi:hypothetical protein ABCS02_14005 [Microbacterium sp. X-17]|uniref:hypothetical protein n=1 Tax=Microbacterium sp. X-17 TaxID=3144404 RepID=UPI0031F58807